MEYSIKEISENIEISEQGLYKRIRTNLNEYKEKGFIIVKLVEKPNNQIKEQIFITQKGLEDLLQTKKMRQGAKLQGLNHLNQVEKPSLETTKEEAKPSLETKKEEDTQKATNELLNLLNQNILDLKQENKRLYERLDKQEERFEDKLEKQKIEFKEQFEKQQEAYQKTLDRIMQSFNNTLMQLQPPKEEVIQTNEVKQEEVIQKDLIISNGDKEKKNWWQFWKK